MCSFLAFRWSVRRSSRIVPPHFGQNTRTEDFAQLRTGAKGVTLICQPHQGRNSGRTSGMLWLTCVLAVVVAAMSFVCMGILLRMFILRQDFEIAARSPQIVLLAGFFAYLMSVSVLLQWLLLSAGTSLPCWVVIWISYAGEPTCPCRLPPPTSRQYIIPLRLILVFPRFERHYNTTQYITNMFLCADTAVGRRF